MSVNYSLALMSSKPGDDTAGGGGSDGDENDNLLG